MLAGYKVVWPGNRLSGAVTLKTLGSLLDLVQRGHAELDWSHVYYLERGRQPSDLFQRNEEVSVITVLRLSTGVFVPHLKEYFPYTMGYARSKNIPVRY